MTLSYPSRDLWPDKIFALPELSYPDELNACRALLDSNIEHGCGDSPAIYFNDVIITYSQLRDEVTRVAAGLRERGVRPGDRVVLRLLNRPHFVSTFLALLRIGAVAVPVSPLLKDREVAPIIESCQPVLVISEDDVAFLPSATPYAECAPTAKDDVAIILYTSGSTGVPKGCMHSHGDLLAIADSYARQILQPTPQDRFGGHPTMAFAYGLGGLLIFPLRFGASTVLLDRFTPDDMVETIQRHRVTIAFCAPTSLRMMMRQGAALKNAVSSLRFVISAGETLPASVHRAWTELTGVEVLDGLGSTELLHVFISAKPGRSRPGFTGEVVPGYEARIVDAETYQPVPDGTAGLLAVKGPTGCRYLQLPDRQRQYVRNGWNFPGDIYVRDSEGFFQYQCRNDDLIICGGRKVGGPEIESVLLEHPAISEVAVVASPDELRGMVPKAFIVLRPSHAACDALKADLQTFVQAQLASYKCPRKIEFVAELPKTSTGKIRRTDLRRAEFQV